MMKMKQVIIAILLLFMTVFAVRNQNIDLSFNTRGQSPIHTGDVSKSTYQKITAEEAYQIMQDTDPYMLLDVRTNEEFKEKRIDGAVLIPDYEIRSRAATELPDKNALLLIYCRSGRRSANVAKELIEMGYTNVYDFGGINDWPYDTISG